MFVRCTFSTGAELGAPVRGNFYSTETVFSLTVGQDYPVLGMGLFETEMSALVCDDTGRPNWLPVGLFDFGVRAWPASWEFALLDGVAASGGDASNRWVAKWGYPELVREPDHTDRLIERDPVALAIFYRELAALRE